jgi:hypothetical protein
MTFGVEATRTRVAIFGLSASSPKSLARPTLSQADACDAHASGLRAELNVIDRRR